MHLASLCQPTRRPFALALALTAALAIVALSPACSPAPAADRGEPTASSSSAIVHGAVDTTHPAVVAVFGGSGAETTLCSGTIVKKDVTPIAGDHASPPPPAAPPVTIRRVAMACAVPMIGGGGGPTPLGLIGLVGLLASRRRRRRG